ncbi:MAG: hypothetical protein WCP73_01685 [Eubacteriales bacterium]
MKDEQKNEQTDTEEHSEMIKDQGQMLMHTDKLKIQERCEPCMHCGYHCKFLNEEKEE